MGGETMIVHKEHGPVEVKVEMLSRIRFTLPSMPVSVNSLYNVIFSEHRVVLKPEARRWKTSAKEAMPPWPHTPGAPVRIDAHFEYKRFYGNGKPRVKDVSNLLKLLIDAVAERYGFNDCLVIAGSWSSADSTRESVTVTVTELGVREGNKP